MYLRLNISPHLHGVLVVHNLAHVRHRRIQQDLLLVQLVLLLRRVLLRQRTGVRKTVQRLDWEVSNAKQVNRLGLLQVAALDVAVSGDEEAESRVQSHFALAVGVRVHQLRVRDILQSTACGEPTSRRSTNTKG